MNSNTNRYIGQAIRNFRKLHDFTLADLSSKINVSYQQLQKYETGTNRIGADMLFEISKILGEDMNKFLPTKKPKAYLPSREALKISKNLDKINDVELSEIMVTLTSRINNISSENY